MTGAEAEGKPETRKTRTRSSDGSKAASPRPSRAPSTKKQKTLAVTVSDTAAAAAAVPPATEGPPTSGDIVWAKLGNWPYYVARVTDGDVQGAPAGAHEKKPAKGKQAAAAPSVAPAAENNVAASSGMCKVVFLGTWEKDGPIEVPISKVRHFGAWWPTESLSKAAHYPKQNDGLNKNIFHGCRAYVEEKMGGGGDGGSGGGGGGGGSSSNTDWTASEAAKTLVQSAKAHSLACGRDLESLLAEEYPDEEEEGEQGEEGE